MANGNFGNFAWYGTFKVSETSPAGSLTFLPFNGSRKRRHVSPKRQPQCSPECQIIFFYQGKSCEREDHLEFPRGCLARTARSQPNAHFLQECRSVSSFFKFHSRCARVKAELWALVFSINIALCARVSFHLQKIKSHYDKKNRNATLNSLSFSKTCFHYAFNFRRLYFPACTFK